MPRVRQRAQMKKERHKKHAQEDHERKHGGCLRGSAKDEFLTIRNVKRIKTKKSWHAAVEITFVGVADPMVSLEYILVGPSNWLLRHE